MRRIYKADSNCGIGNCRFKRTAGFRTGYSVPDLHPYSGGNGQGSYLSGKESIRDYLPREYENAEVLVQEQQKLNNRYTGLLVLQEGGTMTPTVNMEQLFDYYNAHPEMSIYDVMEKISAIIQRDQPGLNIGSILQYDLAKEKLFMRVSSAEKNQELLQNVPYELKEDLAITFHLAVDLGEEGLASTMITNNIMEQYGITKEQLYQDALVSSPKVLPATVENMDKLLRRMMLDDMKASGMGAEELKAMEEEMDQMISANPNPMTVVSNEQTVDGASALFYPGMLDQIGESMKGDYFILPSSINEVIVVPDDGSLDHKELKEMVNEINHTQVAPEERLTDEVYHYDTKERVFEKADRFQQRKLDQAIDGVKDAVKERLQTPKHKATEISL